MIWLKPTASTNIFNPQVESLPCPFPCFKSRYLSWFNTERELRYFHPPKAATVWHPIPQWLSHQVGIQFKSFKSHFHALDDIETYERIEKTIDTHKICSSSGHPDSTLQTRPHLAPCTWSPPQEGHTPELPL